MMSRISFISAKSSSSLLVITYHPLFPVLFSKFKARRTEENLVAWRRQSPNWPSLVTKESYQYQDSVIS